MTTNDAPVFISHSTKDDDVVERLRLALEEQDVPAWVDARELTAGAALDLKIREAIFNARHFLVVLSVDAINSRWVQKEVRLARKVAEKREGFKVIPLLIAPIGVGILPLFFDEEPVALPFTVAPGGLTDVLPDLLAALGLRAPEQSRPREQPPPQPVADLVLKLQDPRVEEIAEGKPRAHATATLVYNPPETGAPKVNSNPFIFSAPLGPIELGELAWYLERYSEWPGKIFQDRAKKVEEDLPRWGQELYDALRAEAAREALEVWRNASGDTARRFTVEVEEELPEGASEERQAEARQGATLLLGLPWELLHDDQNYLFQGGRPVRVRRQLPNRKPQPALVSELPLRVLMVSPRPEDDSAGFIDHRVSARPLVEALAPLGERVEFKLVTPGTYGALEDELNRAVRAKTPYHVVHFDGHGIYDRHKGLGALCFENPQDSKKLQKRGTGLVDAKTFAALLRDHRIPLVFLDACQTAMTETKAMDSVAGQLLSQGVASVVAMSHAVLAVTAHKFVGAFYRELMQGQRVGEAMLAGQRALFRDKDRGKGFTGELHLQDWFVPVLFQEEQDSQLLTELPTEQGTKLEIAR